MQDYLSLHSFSWLDGGNVFALVEGKSPVVKLYGKLDLGFLSV